jgi:NADPH-dependent 2,4-dienoyl-CoA reductase/sulfur reductase-like enzyme
VTEGPGQAAATQPDTDLAVIGAGPAGLAAAAAAAHAGLRVTVIDEQRAGGGQIYRGLGDADAALRQVLGEDYVAGQPLLAALAAPGVTHLGEASVWQVGRDRQIYYSRRGEARRLAARAIIIATGAMERPMPFPGWTLPGVMGAGAAQVLLKTSGLAPGAGLVMAGSGPLMFLLAWQYLRAGVRVDAIVETTPGANLGRALRYLPGALRGHAYLRKGAMLLSALRRAGVTHHRRAGGLAALGGEQVEALAFHVDGERREIPCSTLLLHQGVVPNVQITRSLSMSHDWDRLQRCWRPRLDTHGETEIDGIYVAGDGGGIGGAWAAEHQGRLGALHAASVLGALSRPEFLQRTEPDRRALSRHLAARPFLDALYAPAASTWRSVAWGRTRPRPSAAPAWGPARDASADSPCPR